MILVLHAGTSISVPRRLEAKGDGLPKKPKRTRLRCNKLYSTKRWKQFRELWLTDHPLCADCQKLGLTKLGYAVDHINPHNQTGIFWIEDGATFQTLCEKHHNAKSGRGE